mgnify:CR=1 FL=1
MAHETGPHLPKLGLPLRHPHQARRVRTRQHLAWPTRLAAGQTRHPAAARQRAVRLLAYLLRVGAKHPPYAVVGCVLCTHAAGWQAPNVVKSVACGLCYGQRLALAAPSAVRAAALFAARGCKAPTLRDLVQSTHPTASGATANHAKTYNGFVIGRKVLRRLQLPGAQAVATSLDAILT